MRLNLVCAILVCIYLYFFQVVCLFIVHSHLNILEKILSALRKEQNAEKDAAYAANWGKQEAHH
jgi:hypothetical protein